MIRYALHCAEGHDFESWFAGAAAFDALAKAGRLSCPVCDCPKVDKALMAPHLGAAGAFAPATGPASGPGAGSSGPMQAQKPDDAVAARQLALEALRRQVEANSDYVGPRFASEARAMHEGTVPMRSIYGEAGPEEARRLLEDGVPVAPLPFRPLRSTN